MVLIAIEGVMGSGKTLAMTYLAWRKYLQGLDIYANYHIRFPPYPKEEIEKGRRQPKIFYVKNIRDVLAMEKGYACLDELWASADSRQSGSKKNKIIGQILLKARKKDVHIAYTTQKFHQMDKRIRDVTDFIAYPSLRKNETICILQVCSIIPMKPEPFIKPEKVYKFYTAPFFRFYDTNEIVGSLFGDDDEDKIKEIEKEREESRKSFLDDENVSDDNVADDTTEESEIENVEPELTENEKAGDYPEESGDCP